MTKVHRRAHGRRARNTGWRPTALVTVLLLLAGTTLTTAAAISDDAPAAAQTQSVSPPDGDDSADDGSTSERLDTADAPGGDDSADGAAEPKTAPAAEEPRDSAQKTEEPSVDDEPQQSVDAPVEDAPAVEDAPEAEESPAPPASKKSAPADSGGAVAPLSVPSPSGNSAVITVSVGGDRTGAGSVGDLGGVTLRLHDGDGNGPGSALSAPWASCVSDGDGDCSFIVPDAQAQITERGGCIRWIITGIWCGEYEQIVVQQEGANHNARFWVVAETAPTGWYLNPQLVTDAGVSDYAFRTPGVNAGETYRSGDDFMASGSGSRTSGGMWQLARTNPALPYTCQAGLDVALVLDLSGSVANAGAVGDLKDSAKGMVDALAGTGSSMALYTFADDAPRNGGSSGRNYPATDIDAGNNIDTIKGRIDAYSAGGGTNWDEGIYQVAEDDAGYDLVIVITDGYPTYYNAGGSGSSTRFVEVENAVHSADALKAQGTRLVAVGVGDGTSGSAANLRAVSGQTAYAPGGQASDADYFQASWSQLAGLLAEVARGATCQATIEVTKHTIAYGENDESNGGAGWEFQTTASAGTLSPASSQTTGDSGTVNWTLGFDSPSPAAPATVTVDELLSAAQAGDGWALQGAQCTVNDVPSGDATDLEVTSGDAVECTFVNVQSLVPDIEITKKAWEASAAGDLPGAAEIPAGADVVGGTTITWTYEVRNTGETPLQNIQVVDDQAGAADCPRASLDPGESMTCTASGPVTALP